MTVAICVEPCQRCTTYPQVDLDTFHDSVADGIPSDDVDHHLAMEFIARFPVKSKPYKPSSQSGFDKTA